MNNIFRGIAIAWLAAFSFTAIAEEAESIRQEIEVFLSSGIGNVVSIILLLLFMLWLLLPLAIFGLKSKLNKLRSETRETNRMLADIVESNRVLADTNDASEILGHISETNKLLAEIRDELSVLNDEEAPVTSESSSSKSTVYETGSADYYDEIKYEP